jgi:hypothetical protein
LAYAQYQQTVGKVIGAAIFDIISAKIRDVVLRLDLHHILVALIVISLLLPFFNQLHVVAARNLVVADFICLQLTFFFEKLIPPFFICVLPWFKLMYTRSLVAPFPRLAALHRATALVGHLRKSESKERRGQRQRAPSSSRRIGAVR